MPLQIHDHEVVDGSNLKYTDRVIFGLKSNFANLSSPGVISSVAVTAAGSYATLPTVGTSGNGSGATLVPHMKAISSVVTAVGTGYAPGDTVTFVGGTGTAPILTISTTKLVSSAVNAAGTGYAPTDTITLAGGAFTTAAQLTVATTKVISKAVLAPGSGYAINDTITVAGGTAGTAAIFTVTHGQLVSAAKNAAGSGYAPGDTITLAGGTAGTAAVITVDTVSTGAIATFHISTPGDYTVLSTTFTQASTSGSGTGATFNTGLFGVLTATVTTAGSYTVNATTFTQASSTGSGTGATFNTIVYGVNTFTISNPGIYQTNAASFTQSATSGSGTGATFNTTAYGLLGFTISTPGSLTVLAANPVATTSNGSGTGVTLTPLYGINTITVSAAGTNYDSGSALAITGGGSTGGATGTITLGSQTGNAVTVPVTFGTGADLPSTYAVMVNPQQACFWEVDQASKTQSSFNVILTPSSGSATIAAGVIDVAVFG